MSKAGASDQFGDTGVPAVQQAGRLTADMASLRLLVLDFVRGYITRWAHSPSYGEIAAALNTNKQRIHKAVKSLARDGLILRTPGPRGLTLPDAQQNAIQLLQRLGYQVTDRPLPVMPPLDYWPSDGQEQAGNSADESSPKE